MQRADLDHAAELFDLAGDGRDEEVWAKRFQDHVGQVMRKHSANLRAGGSADAQRVELLRARLELHEVIAERLESRAVGVDPELGALFRRLRITTGPLVSELAASAVKAMARQEPPKQANPPPAPLGLATPSAPVTPVATTRSCPSASPLSTPRLGPPPAPELAAAGGEAALKRAGFGSYSQIHETRRQKEVNPPSAQRGSQTFLSTRLEKELTLRQLRTIISMVYASKAQHDERCIEMREPRETMEQHLYSFLGKRYGHKSLVEEWARAIFRAIEREAPRECDIAVFGKILQNKLAENFAPVQDTLCKTVVKLLRESLQQRHPQRIAADIDAMCRAWTRTGVPLAECEKAVRYMYDDVDSERVLQRLREMPRQAQPQEGAEPADTDLLRYRAFVQTLVGFQMQLTEEFLADFVELFAEVDTDDDGIVNGPQLLELIRRLGSRDGLGAAAAEALDEARAAAESAVRGRQSATFSECVELFNGMIGARSAVYDEPFECFPVEEGLSEDEEGLLEEEEEEGQEGLLKQEEVALEEK
uniref:EF-hand domain-containing protein n=1 Tax=Alexandrium monilatum TaxID=311494 RepID=A0A7S4V0U3_9DINO